ncbi:MAG: PDZ domain-containing protein [Gammaproteobacteria bacterium]
MNTCIAGHRGVRDGVIHTGAVALMLGAALAMNSAHAANDTERDDSIARPAQPVPPAPAAKAATPMPAPAPPAPADRARERADAEARIRDAQERMHDTQAERADVEARLRDAQERMNRAAAEVAAIAGERAREAMENMQFTDGLAPRGPVIGADLDPKSKDGARVLDVSPGGPAEEAGIRSGDVIVMVNGKDMKSDAAGGASRKVTQELREFRQQHVQDVDARIKVRVLREGKPKDFEVAPRRIVNTFAFRAPPAPGDGEPAPGPFGPFNFNFRFAGGNNDLAGLEVTTLTPQLGRYFGASKGVLVVRAPKSELYKLQDGDVIVSIDGREPTSGSHITRILSSYQPGETLTLRVMRDRKAQDIQVTVPERNRQSRVRVTTSAGEPM